MPDYKEMHLTLFRATEKARRILEDAQLECEELYLSAPETKITLLESPRGSDTASDISR